MIDEVRELGIYTAYNANVDAIVNLNAEIIQRLIEEFGPDKIKRRLEEYPREINEPLDFVARLVHALKTGKPMAVPLVNEELHQWFDKTFKYDTERIGGQAGIIANILVGLKVKKVIAYTPFLPKRLAELFKEGILYPVVEEDKLVLKPIQSAYREGDPLKVNRIFEFRKGTRFKLGDEVIEVPHSGRFIVSSRFESISRIETKDELRKFLPEIGEMVDGAILSGYQGIRLQYSDGKDANYYLRRAKEDIRLLKKNKDIKIHVEFASIQDRRLRKKVVNNIFPMVDSVGMDEAEIAYILSVLGYSDLADRIFMYNRIEDAILGGMIILDELNFEILQVHTIYYLMYITHRDNPLSEEELMRSLDFGTILAATRASLGDINDPRDVKVGMSVPYNERSEYIKLRFEEAKRKLRLKEYKVVIVPTRLVPNPVSTVGLGDTISTGTFLSYLSLLRRHQ
ncbi:ADP-specific phosphofructokinase [Pyrococcus furiosus DSM 3638]|uniref:ADP-specific phosphofructokinase n=3 Tax=Pyrococcus furiosus TaxID=2261 RepID=K6PF_PYRFU|nr:MULTISPECIES: ADP-specific phosphofructokinase [Pyrococcus]Q9V2Z7.1 RecName: Full=ADP-specific phosphofructokinase; AltName: Full=ADP-dependent phosphofructokinase; Short=ADP-Pfk [Pyrococcus furiosus DSM 3638]AAD48400.1 phosphofructokinase [Pyrococcus furiosus DSM 3638]AAL81908.1 ADP-dependent phosphofructokinase [Pyrococcus furiosus DSM 3638]AFN04857.1 ADP-specific phosphofructokinase [Pyrococcus furiosus COM1]MDK2870254.1 ADP-dependent phosphofructokinase/glucokinase [Pyrococcus sp.]QEK7